MRVPALKIKFRYKLYRALSVTIFIMTAVGLTPQVDSVLADDGDRPIAHGKLPTDQRYWDFHRWYRTHTVVDLLVNGDQPEHLSKVLSHVDELRKRGVQFREIIVVGGNSFSMLDKSTRAGVLKVASGSAEHAAALAGLGLTLSQAAQAESLSLGEGEPVPDVEGLIQQLQVSNSPVWIVTSRGQIHLFEGYDNLLKQFSRVGEFRGAK